MADRATVERALRRQQEWLVEIEAIKDQVSADVTRLLRDYQNAILRAVGFGVNGEGAAIVSNEQLNVILANMDRELSAMLREAGATFGRAYGAMGDGLTVATLEGYSAFGVTTAQRLEDALGAFRENKLPGLWQQGYDDWISRLRAQGEQLVDALRYDMASVQISGGGQHALAARIQQNPLFQFEQGAVGSDILFTRGGDSLAMELRANRIARDAISNASNRASEEWTTEAGYELYTNYNPLDGRTTPGCEEASEQEPMTLEQWDLWESTRDQQRGRPPRWYLCRSHLWAVPKGSVKAARQVAMATA